ncbi:hypothetical protein [Erythrobacter aureus]|uniref:Uncharacterized protein n=1 Tax=Erythrobacter aureus TaxID=2182384 RepID=A0A345YIQ6_9SPHN|nr:hypothetical protein [Erythrobacter aureus]AXK43808.1 hypothetical protein DVR09_15240 [Erythrobacter aureus]
MSTSLHFATATPRDSASLWAAINAVAPQGTIALTDEVVQQIAELLEGVKLTNGQSVFTYVADNPRHASYVGDFGPCLLEERILAKLRETLAAHSDDAARMLDTVVSLRVQIGFTGSEDGPARLDAVNWEADTVEVRLTNGRFDQMLTTLEIPFERDEATGEVDFTTFEAAVAARGLNTGMSVPLNAFVACAKRHDATKVYWG